MQTRRGRLGLLEVRAIAIILAICGQAPRLGAQDIFANPPNVAEESILFRKFSSILNGSDDDFAAPPKSAPIRIFRMQPGFISDPLGLSGPDDDPTLDGPLSGGGPHGMTLSFGADNPYLEPRTPGDPGGPGFMRLYSQVQVVDLGSTSVCFGMQAWTPAGLENGGVSQGPTLISPNMAFYQDLGLGLGLHGFADQTYRTLRQSWQSHVGLAVQCPLHNWERPEQQEFFFFVQGLGKTAPLQTTSDRDFNWECCPGIQWRVNDSFSMSIGAARQGILTCAWRY
jgi:hypothetical protein